MTKTMREEFDERFVHRDENNDNVIFEPDKTYWWFISQLQSVFEEILEHSIMKQRKYKKYLSLHGVSWNDGWNQHIADVHSLLNSLRQKYLGGKK